MFPDYDKPGHRREQTAMKVKLSQYVGDGERGHAGAANCNHDESAKEKCRGRKNNWNKDHLRVPLGVPHATLAV